ncbi:MAG: Arc family DNA-binding protein [Bosea sp. (in: a-proteobacteria)]|nr:Arc family DNA-binding protein [Bosea sp. (in: a-proteobacteria)]
MSARKKPDDKVANVTPFGLRMLPDLKERIEGAARQNGRSMNAEIVARLVESFEVEEKAERFYALVDVARQARVKLESQADELTAIAESLADRNDESDRKIAQLKARLAALGEVAD